MLYAIAIWQIKMGNPTPCKIITHENLNMKLGTHDNIVDITHHANFG